MLLLPLHALAGDQAANGNAYADGNAQQ
ncbi:hypothetical protein MPLB_160022 [Mesorhizobium sp. ORS 3324]|nr:hypothetical protein MPLB_160022 [Mesorhizobium sp. ORS 3324]